MSHDLNLQKIILSNHVKYWFEKNLKCFASNNKIFISFANFISTCKTYQVPNTWQVFAKLLLSLSKVNNFFQLKPVCCKYLLSLTSIFGTLINTYKHFVSFLNKIHFRKYLFNPIFSVIFFVFSTYVYYFY